MSQVEAVNSSSKPSPSANIPLVGAIAFGLEVVFQVTPDINDFFYVRAVVTISGSQSYKIESEKVRATYGVIVLPFNMIEPPSLANMEGLSNLDEYGGYDISLLDKITDTHNAISITLARPEPTPLHLPGTAPNLPAPSMPIVQLNRCMISPQWLIGVRNIVLVDPTK